MFNRIREEQGFTLIELLVVILIIGILIAVAAPSFLGQQDKAKDSGTKQNMTVLYKGAKAEAASNASANGQYPNSTDLVAALKVSEPQLAGSISVDAAGDPTVGQYEVAVDDVTNTLTISSRSASDALFTLTSVNGGGPQF